MDNKTKDNEGEQRPPKLARFSTTIPLEVVPAPAAEEAEAGPASDPPSGDAGARQGVPTPPARQRGSSRTKIAWGITAVVFAAAAVVIPLEASASDLRPFRPGLVAAVLAVALFAVSLSFVIFQLSPYRALIPGASGRHLAGAVAVLAVALAPIAALAFSPNAGAHVSVAVLPVLVFSSVLLVYLAQREASGEVLLARHVSQQAVRARCLALVGPLREADAELRVITESLRDADGRRIPPPMHEIFHRLLPPPSRDDPFELLVALAAAAVSRGDAHTYSRTAKTAFDALDWVRDVPILDATGKDDHTVHSALVTEAKRMSHRVGRASLRDEQTSAFANQFVDECLRRVRTAIIEKRQGEPSVLDVWGHAVDVAAALVSRQSHHTPITVLMIGRLATEQGLATVENPHERDALGSFPADMEGLGRRAIEMKDTDFLYRCLETIAWIGCAAARRNDRAIGAVCLQALAQLGREVRVAGLECFWQKCLLTPFDHVDERIFWIVSWLPQVPEDSRVRWCTLTAEALSRLHGYTCRVTIEVESDGTLQPRATTDREEPHTESINDNGRLRMIDYSDEKMLKELELR
jgi:hypothetical protein